MICHIQIKSVKFTFGLPLQYYMGNLQDPQGIRQFGAKIVMQEKAIYRNSTAMIILSIPQIAKQNLRPIDVTLTSPITFPKHTPWSRHHPRLNTSLHRHTKLETSGTIFKQHLFELIGHEKFDEELYTDASKDEQRIA